MSDFVDSIPEGEKVFADGLFIFLEELIVYFVIDDAGFALFCVFNELWYGIFHESNLLVVLIDPRRFNIHPLHGVIDLIGAKWIEHKFSSQEISHFTPEVADQLIAKVFERLGEYLLGTLLGSDGGLTFDDLRKVREPNSFLALEIL